MLVTYEEAIKEVKDDIRELLENLFMANEIIYNGISTCNQEKFKDARASLKNTTANTVIIDNNIIKLLALYTPEATDLREVVAYLKITNEILRAATNTRSMIKGLTDACEDIDIEMIKDFALPLQFSTVKAIKLVKDMIDIDYDDELRDAFNETLIEENKTDDLYELFERSVLDSPINNIEDFEKKHKILRVFRKSEKIADRSVSMAYLLLYINIGGTMQR